MIHAIILGIYLIRTALPGIFQMLPLVVAHIIKELRTKGIKTVAISYAKTLGIAMLVGVSMLTIAVGGTFVLSFPVGRLIHASESDPFTGWVVFGIISLILWITLYKAGSKVKAREQETIANYRHEMEIRNHI